MTVKQADYQTSLSLYQPRYNLVPAIEKSSMKTIKLSPSVHRSRTLGVSLIELMIGVVLGIFLVGGVITIFTSNQQSFKINENLARLQESARFAYEQMNREIRDAGTNPCGVRAVNSVVRTPSLTIPWWGDWNAGTLRGFDGNENTTGAGVPINATVNNRVSGTDALIVLRTLNDDGLFKAVISHDEPSDKFVLSAGANFSAQDLLFVCDNNSGAIFEANSVGTTGGNPHVAYDTTSPSSNCSDRLGWASNVDCATNSVTKTFTVGSVITKFDPAIWYVGNASDGRRALYRESMHKRTTPSTAIVTERREFVPDVHDMQIKYLTRTNPTSTGTAAVLASEWVDASVINAQTGTWTPQNTREAIAVKIELTFKSKEAVGTDGTVSQPIERKSISVISLRNREIINP
jgi:type IV pilus assembly protein PilW